MSKFINVVEVFGPTIQGEGMFVGTPTVFVRTGGCDYRCVWCLTENHNITLINGLHKNITEIKVGDVLTAFNELTQEHVRTNVTAINKIERDNYYRLILQRDDEKYVVECSGDHLWYTQRGWIAAQNISEFNDSIMLQDGTWAKCKARDGYVSPSNDVILYDLTCEPYPNFYANGLLSHNCDSLHAVLPEFAPTWEKHTAESLFDKVKELSPNPIQITISGGNPALQPLEEFILLAQSQGYTCNMETQGSVLPTWLHHIDAVTFSPKPPSSNMKVDLEAFDECVHEAVSVFCDTSIKVVIMNEDDYEFAKMIYDRHTNVPFFISVGNDNPPVVSEKQFYGTGEFSQDTIVERLEYIIKRVTSDSDWVSNGKTMPRILPQVHTLIWGNKKGV